MTTENSDENIRPFPGKEQRRRLYAANDASSPREPVLRLPPAVKILCLLLIGMGVVQQLMPDDGLTFMLAFVPARYTDGAFEWAEIFSPVTHLFVHGGWLHIGVNLGMLMAFGAGLEKEIGAKKCLILFFAGGLAGALSHFALAPHSPYPLIGASGAISALFGAVVMMMYRQGALGAGGYRRLLPFVLAWIGLSLFFGFFGMPGAGGDIAWATHIGGFLAGLALFDPVSKIKSR